ncbi:MAG: transcriptional regulator [Rhodobacterales bacterium CG2_30_65_12]|nr:MAG: transcriptional regulator [Rhodobacterales bacterium CG2_30_65_12]
MPKRMDSLFSALADPTRRAVLEQLAEGAQPVSLLAEQHAMALPSFLRHIEVLEAAGLVVTRKQGRARIVALRPGALLAVEDWLDSQKRLWEGRLTRLEVLARRLEAQTGRIPESWKTS